MPASFRDALLDGLVAAYGRYLERVPDAYGVMRAGGPVHGKVSVVIGGGSGHYPAFAGLVGDGIADAAVVGEIFTSPSAEQVYRCIAALEAGAGVLLSYGNYTGDVMNFGPAENRAREAGLDVRSVLVTDDIASAPAEEGRRRGIAGGLFVYKAAGARAAEGGTLDDVEAAARKANAATRSFGVAFAGCTLPGRSAPLFRVEPGRMELGLGVHGEPGVETVDLLPAQELGALLVERVLADAPAGASGEAAVLLNGLGATAYEELFVLYAAVARRLDAAGIRIRAPEVGELETSLDTAGCSLSLMWLDEELAELWEAPAATAAYRRHAA